MTPMQPGNSVLRGRYTLDSLLPDTAGPYEVWNGSDEFSAPVVIKLWLYTGERPDDGDRALWDYELRNLFRLASLPEAEDSVLVLRDTGIDHDIKRFIMVFRASDTLLTLETLLGNRKNFQWLSGLSERTVRAEAWRGLRKLATGLAQLHDQQILHRAIAASTIYVDSTTQPDTLRLGGFEWSIRVGAGHGQFSTYPRTLGPPDYHTAAVPYSFDTDWFLMGGLFARIIAAADPPDNTDYDVQHEAVLAKVASVNYLSAAERDLISALLDSNTEARLSQSSTILRRIDEILALLDYPIRLTEDSYLGLVVLLGQGTSLTRAVQDEDPEIRVFQMHEQRSFIEHDLQNAKLVQYGRVTARRYMLIGQRLCYDIREYASSDSPPSGNWEKAYAAGVAELRYSESAEQHVDLSKVRLKVFGLAEVRRDRWRPSQQMVSWKHFLPTTSTAPSTDLAIRRLYDFFRTTNQIELLMRDAEIFAFEVIHHRKLENKTLEEVSIEEMPRERSANTYARPVGTLVDYMTAQIERQQTGDLFYLGDEETLSLGRRPRSWFWKVQTIDAKRITLTRAASADANRLPVKGFVRSFEQFGQIALINRRLQAIGRLKGHGYLLLALQAPEHVYIDTEDSEPPIPIDLQFDRAKVEAVKNLWRSRPIFTLQGPPGTGKTTLVAHLLQQIFADDPVAQVLITAQAHSAVDVLRERVSRDLESKHGDFEQPIKIRLSTQNKEVDDPDEVEQVTGRILSLSSEWLKEREALTKIQCKWLAQVDKMKAALRIGSNEDGVADMCELVKRSANVTFCTTTAGDLAQLATSTQRFDWSIIEEAGKAHGFDLVLPLQTGHRWLLIGDHEQLPPYRHRDFELALTELDNVMEDLRNLPERGGRLVDVDLIQSWQIFDRNERSARQNLYKELLATFKHLHQICGDVHWSTTNGEDNRGGAKLTWMLTHQHRMHPTIAELISRAYYRGQIVSETVDKNNVPKPGVVHPFVEPNGIVKVQIVWLDVPWLEFVEDQNAYEGREIATAEVGAIRDFLGRLRACHTVGAEQALDVAVLSPYRRQIQELSPAVAEFFRNAPEWLNGDNASLSRAHTVDSFQGNQADVVIVSLVRNNRMPAGRGMGFLDESSRMNVLFSRSERLLVLVGNWEFFRFQMSEIAADADHYLGHWRIALDYIEECFRSGEAMLVPAKDLGNR